MLKITILSHTTITVISLLLRKLCVKVSAASTFLGALGQDFLEAPRCEKVVMEIGFLFRNPWQIKIIFEAHFRGALKADEKP